jgi:hypothetical protein
MRATIQRTLSLSRIRLWLPFACVILAFFSFASVACAAQCSDVDCAQMTDKTAPMDDDKEPQSLDVMIGGGCMLCCNIIVDQPILQPTESTRPLQYSFVPMQHPLHRIAPDIPPPRIFRIV